MTEIDIEEKIPLKKGKYSVVTGFAGAGFIGNNALMYIAGNMGFRLAAEIRSKLLPPMVLLIDGQPYSSLRIYSDASRELLFVISEVIIPSDSAWPIATELMSWLRGKGLKEMVSIDGLPIGTTPKGVKLYGYTTSGRNLTEADINPTREGAVTGINACLLELSLENNIKWTSILAPTTRISSIDYGKSADVIESMNSFFKFGVDPSPLRKSEEMLMKAIKRSRRRGLLGS